MTIPTTTRKSTTKVPAQTLTAETIMSSNLLTVSPSDKLAEALQMMVENHVTGLPVVNVKGCCMGVISATDILTYEQSHADEAEEANAERTRFFDEDTGRWESLRAANFALEHFGHVPVNEVMNTNVISVRSDAPVDDIARLMVDQEIHRVIVTDQTQHLLGSVSAMDIVQLVADGTLCN